MRDTFLLKRSKALSVLVLLCLTSLLFAESRSEAPFIPRAVIFSEPEVVAIKISPDSKYLAYVKALPSGVMNLYLCPAKDCRKLKQLTHFNSPEIYRFFWTGDSKSLVFLKDSKGAKSYQLFSIPIESGVITNHSKAFKTGTAKIYKVSGSRVAVGINDRNPQYHDIFILDTTKGSLTKIFANDRFSRFTFDDDLNPLLKEEVHEDGSIDIYKQDAVFFHFSAEDAFHSRLITIQGETLYYLDSRNSDTTWLKSLDLASGKETKLAHHPESDISDLVFVNGRPFMYATEWLKKEWHRLGPGNFDFLQKKLGSHFEVTSQSKDFWIIRSEAVKRIGASFYLYNRKSDQLTPLFIAKTHPQLAEMIPFEFTARDGLKLTAYLTLPYQKKSLGSLKKPVPLIVFPHGGPFQARNSWSYHPHAQWLASRGYAVLTVNFRSSSGLGKNLVNAGNGEWGRKALFDLIDGVKWCIEKGITTKEQVGIMGGSYGGYATLAALTFAPDEFAVGVSIVGPSSLVTVMQKLPKYWDFPHYPLSDSELFFTRGAFVKSMGGSPQDSKGQQFLASRSPLYFANKIEHPLLLIQGENDPIVNKDESQQMFNALKALHKNTTLLLFADEGHDFIRYANIEVSLAYAEKWLHDALGGSFEPLNPMFRKESSVTIFHSSRG